MPIFNDINRNRELFGSKTGGEVITTEVPAAGEETFENVNVIEIIYVDGVGLNIFCKLFVKVGDNDDDV